MNRLSSPITDLQPEYEVVVIGSGYGGGIAASRMARSGMKVCVMEKGKEFMPGEFPKSFAEASKEMQINKGKIRKGSENGLYEFVLGNDISVFKGCGLGGTSLVNANVAIEAEERVFDDCRWPSEIQSDIQSLKDGIERAREMLKPNPYPEGKNGYPVLAKTQAMRQSANMMTETFKMLDINVNFENKINHVGIEQKKCVNCGDCVTGCNHKAKNSTHMNYLPDAKNHGAKIFTNIAVSHVERFNDKWIVYYNLCNTGREKFDAPLLFLRADKVFLCAGSLGSSEILLRSASKGLSVSDCVGDCFTGNGDVLGFGYNCDVPINGIGLSQRAYDKEISEVGPCITSMIDLRSKDNLEEGMTLEEGSIPGPIRGIIRSSLLPMSRLLGFDGDRGLKDSLTEKWRELVSIFRGPYHGAVNHTQVYLVMTHDDCKGKINLKNDRVNIEWKRLGRQEIFKKVSEKLKSATHALGGIFVRNPTWTKLMNYDLMTVHPLGGCNMGANASTSVVDHKGQVYVGNIGKDLHPGLFILDGAIIPRSVGTNPLLTISGLAERACKIIVEESGKSLNYSFPEVPSHETEIIVPGVQFTETMKGYFSTDEKGDYIKAYEKGESEGSEFEFTLTIQSQDVESFVTSRDRLAAMIGTVNAPALSQVPLTTSYGQFNLFISDPSNPNRKRMNYCMQLASKEGKFYYFEGHKDIHDDKGIDVWKDTTVLFITVFEGTEPTGDIYGKGILKIRPADFIKQLTTMKAINTKNKKEALAAVAKFGKLFAGNVWETYFKKEKNREKIVV